MGNVYIASEDEMTECVIRRLLKEYTPKARIIKSMPSRGSALKKSIEKLNRLANSYPVILLADSDGDCAPVAKAKLLYGVEKNPHFIINIAYDEVETWLMADRDNFARFLHVPADMIPKSQLGRRGGHKLLIETDYEMKASYCLTHIIALQSSSREIREKIAVTGTRCKGAEYNFGMKPFVDIWNIQVAASNSDSLQRMINRLVTLNGSL